MRGLLEFPLNLPEGVIITSARLYTMTGDTVGFFPRNQTFSRIIDDWEELAVTWNNQPKVTDHNALIFSIPYNSGGIRMDFDVTPLVQDALIAGKNLFGLQIRFTEENSDPPANMFYVPREGESQWRPYIVIEYASAPALLTLNAEPISVPITLDDVVNGKTLTVKGVELGDHKIEAPQNISE